MGRATIGEWGGTYFSEWGEGDLSEYSRIATKSLEGIGSTDNVLITREILETTAWRAHEHHAQGAVKARQQRRVCAVLLEVCSQKRDVDLVRYPAGLHGLLSTLAKPVMLPGARLQALMLPGARWQALMLLRARLQALMIPGARLQA